MRRRHVAKHFSRGQGPKISMHFHPQGISALLEVLPGYPLPKAIMETKTAAGRSHREGHHSHTPDSIL
jgi:hypothetical protein